MARIRTYALDDNVTGSDYWIGTDGNNNSNTKNFSPNSVAKYLNENEVVDVSNSIRFRYDTIDSGKPRKEGTLSFATEIGAVVPINSLTTFILSKNTQSTKLVGAFLNILPGTKIILQKSDYINIFGIFKVISVTQIQLEPDFYTVVVQYISGYGSLEEDKDYIISLIDTSEEQNLQQVTDKGSTTTNSITANSFIKIGGTSAQFLKANGSVDSTVYTTAQSLQQVVNIGNGISNYGGIGNASIQSTNFSNNRTLYLNNNAHPTIKLEDNLDGNHYTVIDIDTLNLNGVSYPWSSIVEGTQNLQEVTDEGSTTTNSITIDSLNYYSLISPDAIGTENKTTGSYAFLGADGLLGLKNGTVDSVLKNTDVTNNNVILEFPDKPTGSYTIATTSDVVTQDLQQVTDEGNTTTKSIIANSFVKTGGGPNEILSANGSIIVAGNNISITGGIISSEGGDILTNPNTGISVLDTTIDTIYNTALDPALVMPAAVGGIPALTTVASLSSLNFVQIFNDILFPTQNPTYTIPAITLSSTVTSNKEIGQTFSPVVTLAGTKNDAGLFSQLIIRKSINGGTASTLTTSSIAVTSATAIANQFGYTNPNNPNFSYTVLTTDSGLVIPAPNSGNSSSTVSYSGLGDYTAGLVKKNNKGFNDLRTPLVRSANAPQAAGTNFAPTSRTITGYYPYFYGKASTQKSAADIVSIIQSGTGFEKVMENAAGSLSMTFDTTGEWPWFATYSTYATKTTWVDNANAFNNGSIGGATDLFAAPTTLSVVSSDGYWTTTFKIYPSNKVTTLGTATIA